MELIRYADINSDLYRHIWVVGDIHGCYSLLLTRLAQLNFSPDTDLLISTGDNIDRGKENLETLRLLNTPWFISVVGNHEAMALDAFEQFLVCKRWLLVRLGHRKRQARSH